ncbi:MAG TPA: hypothetical protein ENI95_08825 [Chloroflexi bacterium]|nr:hypothetical protein [Chloroflexota bacterium]
MAKIRPRVPIGLPITGVILLVAGLFIGPILHANIPEEKFAENVLLNAIPFILIFVAIVLFYITVIWLVASVLNNNVSHRLYRIIEAIIIAGIVSGVVGMFQPWAFILYRVGFHVLLISTIAYIMWSHIIPKGARPRQDLSGISVGSGEGEP